METIKYVRIFELEPDDDFVTKRASAIKDLKAVFGKISALPDIVATAADVCHVFHTTPKFSDSLLQQIEDAIRKHSVSFERDGHELEIGVCGMAAVIEIVESNPTNRVGWTLADVFAVALWSALSYLPPSQTPKLDDLRLAAIQAARSRILRTGYESRKRTQVIVPGGIGDEPAAQAAFGAAAVKAIEALQVNAAHDREEIELLWWVLADYSDIIDSPHSQLSPSTLAISVGLEVGSLLRVLPTQSHRNLVLRNIPNGEPISLAEVIVGLGSDREKIAKSFEDEKMVEQAPMVFPLLSSIRSGIPIEIDLDTKKPLQEWAFRALLERTVLGVQHSQKRVI